jgi:hypothetical protein
VGKRQRNQDKNHNGRFSTRAISTIHLAAASGDPKTLRLFTTDHQFDPLVTCCGATSLHFAVASRRPTSLSPSEGKATYIPNRIMDMKDFYGIISYGKAKGEDAKSTSYEEREACISVLVQAGVDVWQEDENGNFPDPGISASGIYQLSWQKMVASETLEAKRSLNEAGNAISVVAALVATASYVGPLTPPLGYADDFVQTSNLSIRIFMVTTSVSFYLAIASIMFAVVPSLPMPQEGIYEEWQRTRKTIGIAISLLLMSVLGVLISFTAASNAVVSEEYSWRPGGLTFYPIVVGGLVCLIGIIWFFIRLLRLMCPESVMIRHFYQSLFRIKRKEHII